MGIFGSIKGVFIKEEKTIDDEMAEAYDRMRARRALRDKDKHKRVLAEVIMITTSHSKLEEE